MTPLIVVDDPADWPADQTEHRVVSASDYLHDATYGEPGAWQVINLCNCGRYQSTGHYVSLLAEAREHQPLPSLEAMVNLQSTDLIRLALPGVNAAAERALEINPDDKAHTPRLKLRICFGRDVAGRHEDLSRQIYERLPVPLLSAHFLRRGERWYLRSLKPLALHQVPPRQRLQVALATTRYLQTRRPRHRFRLAILQDKDNPIPASDPQAIGHFITAASDLGIHAETIGRHDSHRLPEFDGLFIRDNTFINHYTYRFSQAASARGLAVIDDPVSILRCNNKVFLAELLVRHRIPIPKTLIVERSHVDDIANGLALPCVLKQPDSCLSLGVRKAESAQEVKEIAEEFLRHSQLILAQEFMPTDFDWRVGILDGHPLFACRYYMVPGHWQIVRHESGNGHYEEGTTTAVPLDRVPQSVLDLALRAARLIGNGFYGVDIKEVAGHHYVIEVNDNPNVDAGNEDGVLQTLLYRDVMSTFARRMEARRSHRDIAP